MPKKKKIRVKAKSEPDGDGIRSFEDSLNELEKIVSELESGNLSLADSLEKYEAGIKNLKSCHRILETAENRIRLLTGVDSEGKPITQDFEGQETELHQRADKRSMDREEETDPDVGEDDTDEESDIVDDSGSLF